MAKKLKLTADGEALMMWLGAPERQFGVSTDSARLAFSWTDDRFRKAYNNLVVLGYMEEFSTDQEPVGAELN